MSKNKVVIDDGCNSELVETAFFEGLFEMPKLYQLKEFIIPKGIVPFSQRKKSKNFEDFIAFYEPDVNFGDFLRNPDIFIEEFRLYPGVISTDSSLYWDMPLAAQIVNCYRNKVSCYHCQNCGIYTIPNIRWGDERTYTTDFLPEMFPFLGVPKHSIVSIGTYGCISNKEKKYHFRHGLSAMLDVLEPEFVLVYGSMPDAIFTPFLHRTQFIQYPDWISKQHQRVS